MGSKASPIKFSNADVDSMRDTLRNTHGILVGQDMKKSAVISLFKKAEADAATRAQQHQDQELASTSTSSNASNVSLCDDCWGVILSFCDICALYAACTACQQLRILSDEAQLFSKFTPSWQPSCRMLVDKHGAITVTWGFENITCEEKQGPVEWFNTSPVQHPQASINAHFRTGTMDLTRRVPWSEYWSLRHLLVDFEHEALCAMCEHLRCKAAAMNEWWFSIIESVYKTSNDWWRNRVFKERLKENGHPRLVEAHQYFTNILEAHDVTTRTTFLTGRSYLDLYHTKEDGSLLQQWAHIEANRHAGMHCLAYTLFTEFDWSSVSTAEAERYNIPHDVASVAAYRNVASMKTLDSTPDRERDVLCNEHYGFSKVKSRDYQEQAPAAQHASAPTTNHDLGASTSGRRTLKKRRAQQASSNNKQMIFQQTG